MSTPSKNAQAEHFAACGELILRLLPGSQAAGVFGADSELLWQSEQSLPISSARVITKVLQSKQSAQLKVIRGGELHVLPLLNGSRAIGAIAVLITAANSADIGLQLKPVIAVLTHELQARPTARKSQELTERTQELEWLFTVTSELRSDSSDTAAVEQLLAAAMERMGAVFGGEGVGRRAGKGRHRSSRGSSAGHRPGET